MLVGLGQCVAEMVAAQRFNAEQGNDIVCIYGTITSGIDWLFLKLEGKKLYIDMSAYQIAQCDTNLRDSRKYGGTKGMRRIHPKSLS